MEKGELFARLGSAVGKKVEIINKFGLHKGRYLSSVVDIREGLVGLAQPMYRGAWVSMSGMELTVSVEMDGSVLEMDVRSKKSTTKGQVPILWVELTENIRKVQRRSFVRIPCFLQASCCPLSADDGEARFGDVGEWFRIALVNISLGGTAASPQEKAQSCMYARGMRYLLAVNFGNGLMFLKTTMRNIFPSEEGSSVGAFSFDDVSSCQEKIIGEFVRKQELAGKG